MMGMSGLLSSLEKFTNDLAEKQANETVLKDSTEVNFAGDAVDNGNGVGFYLFIIASRIIIPIANTGSSKRCV